MCRQLSTLFVVGILFLVAVNVLVRNGVDGVLGLRIMRHSHVDFALDFRPSVVAVVCVCVVRV
jgi:hypothetical protein